LASICLTRILNPAGNSASGLDGVIDAERAGAADANDVAVNAGL
jgi:hypothetical protein